MARDGFANGTCPTSIVCMPMTKVWASAARISSVVAVRPAVRLPAREMDGVGDARGGVEDQGKEVQRVGA